MKTNKPTKDTKPVVVMESFISDTGDKVYILSNGSTTLTPKGANRLWQRNSKINFINLIR